MPINRREFLKLAGVSLIPFPSVKPGPIPPEDRKFLEGPLVYFSETGHHLSGPFLKFYLAHRKGYLLGTPITEKMRLRDGRAVQFFTNACLEQRGNSVVVSPLAERLAQAEKSAPSSPPLHQEFYDKYGGEAFFGRTLTPILTDDNGIPYQFTENFVIVREDPTVEPELRASYKQYLANREKYNRLLWPGEYKVLPLGKLVAEAQNIDTSPVEFNEYAIDVKDLTPTKKITVDISDQLLTAFEDNTPIMQTFISSGRRGYDTPFGNFSVTKKYLQWRYISPFPNDWYDTPHVPWNLLVVPSRGIFLHGVFWHSVFGQRRSHGCVNMNLDDAKWTFDWAEIGTEVIIIP